MTTYDYHLTMTKVGIADLKAHLSEHLRAVRRGHTILVLDRETSVARIVPIEADANELDIRLPTPGAPPLGKISMPPAIDIGVGVVDLLLEDRAKRLAN